MILFADRNIPPKFVSVIQLLDAQISSSHKIEVRMHKDFFTPTAPDVEWLRAVAQWNPKPCVLCYDGRILRNPAEKAVLQECDLTFVYFKAWADLPFNSQVSKIADVWPGLIKKLNKTSRPTVYEVAKKNLDIRNLGLTAELGK